MSKRQTQTVDVQNKSAGGELSSSLAATDQAHAQTVARILEILKAEGFHCELAEWPVN